MFASQKPGRPRLSAVGLVLLWLPALPAGAQLVDWEAALAANATTSSFVAVEATLDAGGGTPAALVAGNFSGTLNFGPAPTLGNPSGQDGVVARLDPGVASPWDVTWKLQASSSTGNVIITDLAFGPDGNFYVCGSYSENATFGTTTLNAPGSTRGFVAWGDPDPVTPSWLGAFNVFGMAPASLAVAGAPVDIYLTGPGVFPGDLAQKYDQSGAPLWSTAEPLPNSDTNPTDIAVDPGAAAVYVLSEDPSGGTSEEVVLHQLDEGSGTANWIRRMGSAGPDNSGGLGLAPDGDPRVSFSSVTSSGLTYNTNSLPGFPNTPGRHAVMLRVKQTGDLLWSTPLGAMATPGSEIRPTDLSVDETGSAFVCAEFNGAYDIEGVVESGAQDAAVAGVDAAGLLFEFQRSQGTSNEIPHAVAVPAQDLVVQVGEYLGSDSEFNQVTLPNAVQPQGFVAIATPVPGQLLQILRPLAGTTVADLRLAINEDDIDGQIYSQLQLDGTPFAISTWLTTDQIINLLAKPGINFSFESDNPVDAKGTTSSADWALGHLNTVPTTAGSYSFTYPDNTETVYVYLIDTAVGSYDTTEQADLDTFFAGNGNLTLLPTTLIRGAGDPTVSSVFEHGTQMLSLIGGPETGAAEGVPIVVKNFDFYPNGESTTSSLLADAIDAAMTWHDTGAGCSPGLIVIASGSSASGSSSTIDAYLDYAKSTYGLASVIAAGNESGDAADFTPAENGSKAGIICAAASTESEFASTTTNTGTDVDLYAPGEGVRVVDYDDPTGGGYDSVSGTSASAALTAAVAVIHLSMNPWLTPADLETELTSDVATTGSITVLQVATTGPEFTGDYDMWADYHDLSSIAHTADDDGDGWTNLEEYFYGLDACGPDLLVEPLAISYDHGSGDYSLAFEINALLVDASDPDTLRDDSTLDLTSSTDLTTFTSLSATPTVGTTSNGRTAMSHTDSAGSKCFYRLDITPSTPSP